MVRHEVTMKVVGLCPCLVHSGSCGSQRCTLIPGKYSNPHSPLWQFGSAIRRGATGEMFGCGISKNHKRSTAPKKMALGGALNTRSNTQQGQSCQGKTIVNFLHPCFSS